MLNTCQTDSESLATDSTKVRTEIEHPEAPKPVESKHDASIPATNHPLGASVTNSEPEVPVVAQPATEATKEAPKSGPEVAKPVVETSQPTEEVPKPATQEPQTGEKRDLDSLTAQAPEQGQPPEPATAPEKVDEPESKKQKMDEEPTKDTNGTTAPADAAAATSTAPAPATESHEEPKKAGRSKKEKIKEVVKSIIPTDGPGSRTRSRTKDS